MLSNWDLLLILRFPMTHKSALFKDFKYLEANIFKYLCQINPQMWAPEIRITWSLSPFLQFYWSFLQSFGLFLWVMTNLDSTLKSRDITLSTKFHLVKAMVFPVVMYGCESWTVKKAESRRIDAFELWCWRRLLRVPWTARRSNQSILTEISPGCSLEGLMLKLNSNTLAT